MTVEYERLAEARPTEFEFELTFKGDLKGCLSIYDLVNGMTDVEAQTDFRATGGSGLASLNVRISHLGRPSVRVALDAVRVILENAQAAGIVRD